MAREDGPEFVRWREEFVSQERGNRVVHYYLDDAGGGSHLAVVGTERSLRHMLYVVSEDFRSAWGCGGIADDGGGPARKWRSRREVVEWLASLVTVKALVSKFSKSGSYADNNDSGLDGYSETDSFQHQNLGKDFSSDITWSGSFWTCGKQLRHYQAFCRNGTTISTHTFVLVLSEEESRYLAYLEDMYEDKKGQKKVKVRWFHQNQEFACAIPPPPPHPCEVFITPYTQVISVECVDDIATVLTPDHYEKCSNALPTSSLVGIRFCFRQYSKNKFKHFDLSTLRGYFSQAVVLSLKIPAESKKDGEITPGKTNKFPKQYERLYSKCLGTKICRGPQADSIPPYQMLNNNKQSPGKHLSIKFTGPQNQLKPTYNAGDRIEILSQDSGIIGCWFRCTVLKSCASHNRLKVQYDDLQNADDSGRLEEMVPVSTLALPDKLGLRSPDRLRIRPRPQHNTPVDGAALLPGTAIDVWQFSGWWEGVVVSLENTAADSLRVYFPGENFFGVCQLQDVRISKEWVKNQWLDIEMKTNVLSQITSDGVGTRQPDNVSSVGVLDSNSSAVPEQEAIQALSNRAKPVPEQGLAVIQTSSNGDKPVPEQGLAVIQASSNGDKPVPEEGLTASQETSHGDKETEASMQTEVSLTDKTTSVLAEDGKQTIVGKRPRDAEPDCNHGDKQIEASKQTEVSLTDKTSIVLAEASKQTEVSLTDKTTSVLEEDEKKTILGKPPRDDAEQDCNHGDRQTEASKQTEVSLTDKTSSDLAEASRQTEVSLTDMTTSVLAEDEKQTILGKCPRDYAEQDCNHGDKQTESSKQTEVSLTDKASSVLAEDEKQTILGKRPRDDAGQDCNGEIGVDVKT